MFCVYNDVTMMFFISPRFERYIPGMALLLHFYEKHETNAKQEISASFIATSADSIDVIIKFPEVLVETFTTYSYIEHFY